MPPRDDRLDTLPTRPPHRRRLDHADVVRLALEGWTPTRIAHATGFRRAYVRQVLARLGVAAPAERMKTREPLALTLSAKWQRLVRWCRDSDAHDAPTWARSGVQLARAWEDFWGFYDWSIAAGYRRGLVLDVADGATEVSPSTCRWIERGDWQELRRGRDRRQYGRLLTAFGETKSASGWLADRRCKVGMWALYARLRAGHDAEVALSTPPFAPMPSVSSVRPPTRRLLDQDEIVRLHVEEEKTTVEIAHRLGASVHRVRDILQQRGVHRPPPSPRPHRRQLRSLHQNVIRRCEDPKDRSWALYGGKGARVCDEWATFEPFYAWCISAGYRPGLVLRQRRGAVEYSPANCYFDDAEAARSDARKRSTGKRRPQWVIDAFGERKGPTQWTRDPRCSVTLTTLITRLASGMTAEQAIAMPPRTTGPRDCQWRPITAWGETKSVSQWSRDRRCRVTLPGLVNRLARGLAPESAIGTPPFGDPR